MPKTINEYLIGQLIQDQKTINSQMEYLYVYTTRQGKPLDNKIFQDLVKKSEEITIKIKGQLP